MSIINTKRMGRVFQIETEQLILEYTVENKEICANPDIKYHLSIYAKYGKQKKNMLDADVIHTGPIRKFRKMMEQMLEEKVQLSNYQKYEPVVAPMFKKLKLMQYNMSTTATAETEDFYLIRHILMARKKALIRDAYTIEIGTPVIAIDDIDENNIVSIRMDEIGYDGMWRIYHTIDEIIQLIDEEG